MSDTDNINIFMVDPDGTVPEEAIDEYGYVCIAIAEEDDEDFPTEEELAEILQEIAESDYERNADTESQGLPNGQVL